MRKFCLIIALVLSINAMATEYYVSTKGSNSNNGLSPNKAWKTITYAARMAKAGDVVWIKAGNYGGEQIQVRNSGTSTKPIVFIGYKSSTGDIKKTYYKYKKGKRFESREMPFLDGKNRGKGIAWTVQGKKYIEIRNIQISNYKEFIRVTSSSNIVIDRVLASHAGVGDTDGLNFASKNNSRNTISNSIVINVTDRAIAVGGNKNIIEDCETYADEDDIGGDGRSMDYHIFLTGSDNIIRRHHAEHVGNLRHTGHGLVLKGNGHRTENNLIEDCDVINLHGSIEFRHRSVKNNIARDIRIVGINSSSPGGVHFRDGTSFNIVENCVIKNIKGSNGAFAFYDSVEDGGTQWAASDNIIRNCIIENSDIGIKIGSSSSKTYSEIYNNKILNCTFYNVKTMYRLYTTSTNRNNVIKNSIIYGSDQMYYRNEKSKNWIETQNNYYSNKFSKPSGSSNVSLDPRFRDPSKGNFRLKLNSQLKNEGNKLEEVKSDYDKKTRIKGTIGAFEYQDDSQSSIEANAGNDVSICSGDEVELTATGGSTYLWSTGATTSKITVSPTDTTTYTVTVGEGSM